MLGKAYSAVVKGIQAGLIEVWADISAGLPGFELSGNLSSTVKEAKERVRMAIKNSNIRINPAKIIINLSPANIYKDGPHFDLAIAMAVLAALGIVDEDRIRNTMFAGELSLDGKINPVNAILPMVICAYENNMERCIVPYDNKNEGACINNMAVYGVNNLNECIEFINGGLPLKPVTSHQYSSADKPLEFLDVRGQRALKRAAMVAAASMHNMLILGPPGSGKTMTAMRIPDILPKLSFKESIDISKIYSVAGLLNNDNSIISKRPFRNPHYTITKSAFSGGGFNPSPGEISLAQSGVLFLDEINLFGKEVLEILREPLETGKIFISRNKGKYEYNAGFMLVGAMNPCRCGYYPDRTRCRCTEMEIKRYIGKLSKPILDRIDIFINASRVSYEDINQNTDDEYSTEIMRRKIQSAVLRQNDRYKKYNFNLNSQIPAGMIKQFCSLDKETEPLLKMIYEKYSLSARGYNKILKVSRTIADIEGHEKIELADLSEAVGYKAMEGMNG